MPVTASGSAHLSYSAIRDYAHCPKAFQLQRVLELDPTPAYALAGGRAVHSAIEAFERMAFATRSKGA